MTMVTLEVRGPEAGTRRRRRRVPWRRLLLLFVAAYAAVLGARELVAYRRIEASIAATQVRLATLGQQDARLQRQIRAAHSPAYIEQEAQAELGLVPRNTIPFQPIR